MRLPNIGPYISRIERTWLRRLLLALLIVPVSIAYSIDIAIAHFFNNWIGARRLWQRRPCYIHEGQA